MKKLSKVGTLLIIIGVACILLKAIMGSSVAEDGTLIEPFFLLPVGFGAMSMGIIVLIVSLFVKH